MVKKLFKHEFHFYGRIMAIVYAILLTVSVATRIIVHFESDTTAYEIIRAFTYITYVVSAMATFFFAFVMGIVRFYKNMFTSEGYLTHTLPVTANQHIMVKTVTAVCVNWTSTIMVLLSFVIIIPADHWNTMWKDLGLVLGEVFGYLKVDAILIAVEYFILLVLASFSGIMLYYTCISLGQLFKKNRILAAVGVYFAYYILTQIVSTIMTISLTVFTASNAYLYDMMMWIGEHPMQTIHIIMWSVIVIAFLFVAIEYLVIRWVMTKKLNLE